MSVSSNPWFAGLVVAVCVVMLVRMCLGERRRAALDDLGWRSWRWVRSRSLAVWRWRRHRDDAARLAEEAIQRARRTRADKDGNVIRPEAFKETRKSEPRKPH